MKPPGSSLMKRFVVRYSPVRREKSKSSSGWMDGCPTREERRISEQMEAPRISPPSSEPSPPQVSSGDLTNDSCNTRVASRPIADGSRVRLQIYLKLIDGYIVTLERRRSGSRFIKINRHRSRAPSREI